MLNFLKCPINLQVSTYTETQTPPRLEAALFSSLSLSFSAALLTVINCSCCALQNGGGAWSPGRQ